jgi:hypothetical protein
VDVKRFAIGTVAGGITLMAVGYVIWNMLFVDFFAANAGSAIGVVKDPQLMWALALGALCYAALLTLAIETRAGSATIVEALKTGAIVGGLMWFAVDFTLYAVWNVSNLTAAIADSVLEMIRAAISSGVIAAVLGAIGGTQGVTQTE